MIIFIGELFDYLCRNSARSDIEFPQFRELINSRKPITFYNWECPARSPLRPVKDLPFDLECDFLDDEASVEKTRLVERNVQEREFVERVVIPLREGLGIKVGYFKFLADTNPAILCPYTIRNKQDEIEIVRKMFSFTQRLQRRADAIVGRGNIQAIPFSQIRALYPEEYLRAYNSVYYSFSEEDTPQTRLIPAKVFRGELEELAEHIGVSLETERRRVVEFTKRVASSYAAEEYLIRTSLSNGDWFQNPVCVSNESMFTFPIFANAYLGKDKRGPWLFLLYKREEQKK